DVTPVGKAGFLAYRVGITALIAAAITLYAWPLILPSVAAPIVAVIAVLVAASSVGFAVVLPAIARNKVEGLAVTKLTNLLSVAPLLAAIPSPLRFLAAPLPPFWIGELLGLTTVAALPFWLAALAGAAVHALAVLLLFRLFARRAG
ncbi:MAG: hypothetical protein JNM64_01485, partial [Chloroflexia bacterium]|nr:hypothetical protein [Chloroflexia bacterium]